MCVENRITGGHWPFSMHFSKTANQKNVHSVEVEYSCPNVRTEWSGCGPYKVAYNIAYAHARRSNGSYTAFCTQRTKSSQSLVCGTAIVEAWVY